VVLRCLFYHAYNIVQALPFVKLFVGFLSYRSRINPSSSLLVDAARRADHDRDKFKERVLSSLKQIALLKQQRALNIVVRFYDHAPLFRLMFIDSTFCLLSYYVMGEGDGSQLPQLHLLKRPFRGRSVNSLYFAFEVLYNREWDQATPWDFKEFI
jgi:hypothetical protein